MPNTVLQYRLPHYLPGIGGGDRGNCWGVGGERMRLSGVIGVGMLRAIAWDLGCYAGVCGLSGAIAIDTRDLSKILPNPHRLIVKFYERTPAAKLSLQSFQSYSSRMPLQFGVRSPSPRPIRGDRRLSLSAFGSKIWTGQNLPPIFPLFPLALDSVKIQIS
jgi:hypothetical protein